MKTQSRILEKGNRPICAVVKHSGSSWRVQ
jgi:hypothetical protein